MSNVAAFDMPAARLAQQLARALLVYGVSGEIVHSPSDGFTVIVEDEAQLEKAAAFVAKHFSGAVRVICNPAAAHGE